MLNTLERTLKIEVVEDDKATAYFLKKKLSRNIEGCKIIERDRPEYLFPDLGFEKPMIIILDWFFPGYNSLHLIPRLSKYKGLVCIFSNEDSSNIRKAIVRELGEVPKNVRIFNKFNYEGMELEIVDYIADNF